MCRIPSFSSAMLRQSLAAPHGTAPESVDAVAVNRQEGAFRAHAVVAAEAAVNPLGMAQGVEINLLRHLKIGDFLGDPVKLHRRHIGIHDGAGLGP